MFSKQAYRSSTKLWKATIGTHRRLSNTLGTSKLSREELDKSYYAIKLANKSLLRVTGDGSFIYLQSLLTNDMRRLLPQIELDETSHENVPSIYSYILSSANRVLCDLFVYRSNAHRYNTEFILEVDKRLALAVKRLLLGYNLNRDIKVELVHDIDLWSVLPFTSFLNHAWRSPNHQDEKQPSALQVVDSDDIKLIADPRLGASRLGYRLLTRLDGKAQPEDIAKYLGPDARLEEGRIADYRRLKYLQGISEGYDDLRSGFYFPFELNGDFLDAVRLDKGLFTSEKKVITYYNKAPIKRRLVSVRFKCTNQIIRERAPAPSTAILSKKGNKDFGELRARVGRYGIASLRVPMANNFGFRDFSFDPSKFPLLYHADTGLSVEAVIPSWWPENYDALYLNSPDYPLCLFNFKEDAEEEQLEFEFLQADDQSREQLSDRN